jgi:hypothetical protein
MQLKYCITSEKGNITCLKMSMKFNTVRITYRKKETRERSKRRNKVNRKASYHIVLIEINE